MRKIDEIWFVCDIHGELKIMGSGKFAWTSERNARQAIAYDVRHHIYGVHQKDEEVYLSWGYFIKQPDGKYRGRFVGVGDVFFNKVEEIYPYVIANVLRVVKVEKIRFEVIQEK